MTGRCDVCGEESYAKTCVKCTKVLGVNQYPDVLTGQVPVEVANPNRTRAQEHDESD